MRITWDPATLNVSVYFDCELRQVGGVDLINDIFNGNSMVYWGFSAATGGANNNQTVCLSDNIVLEDQEIISCPGAPVQLDATGITNGIFQWLPLDDLDNPGSLTPLATPQEDVTYTLTFQDLCGNPQFLSYEITMEELEVTIDPVASLDCMNPEDQVTFQTNFDDINVEWSNVLDGVISENEVLIVEEGGWYFLDINYENACFASDSVAINSNFEFPEVTITAPGEINCDQNFVPLGINGDIDDLEITWSTMNGVIEGDPNSFGVNAVAAGEYSLSAFNAESGCETNESVTITSNLALPLVNAGMNDSISCSSPILVVQGVEFDDQFIAGWTTTEGSIIDQSSPFSPELSSPGIYYLTVTNPENGCTTSDSMQVFLDGELGIDASMIAYPNILTLQQDGKNDVFKPFLRDNPFFELLDVIEDYTLEIRNRWGGEVAMIEDSKEWNGKINGTN
ncbi:MAG: hypothetical protein AAF193_08975, partial [Bacteroidota bacterium]